MMKRLYFLFFIFILFYSYSIEFESKIIGHSEKSRPVFLYRFGKGSNCLVVIAGVHGDEANSTETAFYIIRRLSDDKIILPENRSIFIIPEANPDGLYAGTRLNANNVDINRNFKTNFWQETFIYKGKTLSAGKYPFSESESRCLKDFLIFFSDDPNKTVVLTLHSKANAIIDGSESYFNKRLSGFLRANSSYKLIIDYPTFGDLEKWLSQRLNIASATIEMKTKIKPDNDEVENIIIKMLRVDYYEEFYSEN